MDANTSRWMQVIPCLCGRSTNESFRRQASTLEIKRMIRETLLATVTGVLVLATLPAQVVKDFVPVTDEMLLHPSPDDWLMYSRTYDAQRFSPLKQVDRSNVSQLRMAWTRGLGVGTTETIPIVHNGVM